MSAYTPHLLRWAARALAVALLTSLLLGLAACGGGSDEDDDTKTMTPPDCKANPELCQ